jgi:hypothetical protein
MQTGLFVYQFKEGGITMSRQEEAKLTELQERLDQEFAQVVTTELAEGPHLQQLSSTAISLGFDSYIGSIAFAGQRSSGSYSVQFNAGNTGYSSAWPQWAFEQAKSALLYGKKLWVISNGKPFGSNLSSVLIMSSSV